MRRQFLKPFLAICLVAIGSAVFAVITPAYEPIDVPDLTVSALSGEGLAALSLDVFAKGLETQSDYLLGCSADSALLEYIESRVTALRAQAIAPGQRGATGVSTSEIPAAAIVVQGDSLSGLGHTLTAVCHVRLFVEDSLVYLSNPEYTVLRTPVGWRVTDVPDIDTLCALFFGVGVWQ